MIVVTPEDLNLNLTAPSILQVDLLETENEFQIHADLPGVDEKDVDISIENNHLVIKGHREKKYEVNNATEHRIERSFGTVQRSIRLPPNADQSTCNANFENGQLRVSLTKVAPRPAVSKIQVSRGKSDATATVTSGPQPQTDEAKEPEKGSVE
jgi:HSP20 family molecular chaperone IbpA